MARYEESRPGIFYAVVFIVASFIIIYDPLQIGYRELYWNEGEYAAMVQEMDFSSSLTVVHGELAPGAFPLFPYAAALLYRIFGLPIGLCLRLVSVIFTGGVTILAWEAARRALDIQAAAVAAVVTFSSLVVIEKTLDGYPNSMGVFFLFSAWLAWFTYGFARGMWNRAWIISFFFCGLALYSIGWSALIYFFFPLIFMRRPMTLWPKLRKPGFFLGLMVLLIFILAWGIPRWSAGSDIPFKSSIPFRSWYMSNYFTHLLIFPFALALRFLPWALIAWAPFCVAYFPLDRNPIFSRFLRTICISLFFLLWLSPFTRTRSLMLLAPPLAVLTGINYWLLVRRHGHQVHALLKLFSVFAAGAGLVVLAFYLLPAELWKDVYTPVRDVAFRHAPEYFIRGMIYSGSLVIIAIALFFWVQKRGRVWEHILLVSVSVMIIFWALVQPYKAQDTSKRQFGRVLREAIGEKNISPSLTVFKDKKIMGLYNECYYLGTKIRKIHSLEEIPRDEKIVYLVSTDVPVFPARDWTNLLPRGMTYKSRKIYLWKGLKIQRPVRYDR